MKEIKRFNHISKAWYGLSKCPEGVVDEVSVQVLIDAVTAQFCIAWTKKDDKIHLSVEIPSCAYQGCGNYFIEVVKLLTSFEDLTPEMLCEKLLDEGYEDATPYPGSETHATHILTSAGEFEIPAFAAEEMASLTDKELFDKAFKHDFVSPFHFAELVARGIAKEGMSKEDVRTELALEV